MQKYKKRQSQIRLNDDSVIQNNFAQKNETKKESLYYKSPAKIPDAKKLNQNDSTTNEFNQTKDISKL